MMQAQAAAVAHLPAETQLKLRRASWCNFAASMLQLACSVAIIIMVRYNLEASPVAMFPSIGGQTAQAVPFQCLMATYEWPSACQYAYSVASISILLNFLLSLMQCLTMDCCGMGRLLECLVDAGLIAWWMAAGITLGTKTSNANQVEGYNREGHRNAVIALCWLSMALFCILLIVNGYLTLKLGRAYVSAARMQQQQQQQYGPGIQMASPFPGGGPAPYPNGGMPAGYPPAWGAPQGAPAYGYPAAPQASPWGMGPPQGHPGGVAGPPPPGMQGAPGPYHTGGPPIMHAVVGGSSSSGVPPMGMGAQGGPGGQGGAGPSSGYPQGHPDDKQLPANPANYLPPSTR